MPVVLTRSIAITLCFVTGCGSISFSDSDGALSSGADGGPRDAVDDGENSGGFPDAAVKDTGSCRERLPPLIQANWPYKYTQASYELHFGSVMPDRSACSAQVCHGGQAAAGNTWGPPVSTPLIPPENATLDQVALQSAIDGLWSRSKATPDQVPAPPDPIEPLLWHHAPPPDGANQPPSYTPDQVAYIKSYFLIARKCGWVPIQMQERGLPPQNCVNGLCDCPITLDLSYCNQ